MNKNSGNFAEELTKIMDEDNYKQGYNEAINDCIKLIQPTLSHAAYISDYVHLASIEQEIIKGLLKLKKDDRK